MEMTPNYQRHMAYIFFACSFLAMSSCLAEGGREPSLIYMFGDSAAGVSSYENPITSGYFHSDHRHTIGTAPAIYVFGDSTADVGNNNFLPEAPMTDKANFPYSGIDYPGGIPTGRFSNGFVAVDYFARFIGLTKSPPAYLSVSNLMQLIRGANFASGGSGIFDETGPGTISMKQQIAYFQAVTTEMRARLDTSSVDSLLSKSIFYFSTGSNDLFAFNFINSTTEQRDQFATSLVAKFGEQLETLYNMGARKFFVVGTGKVGCIPVIRSQVPAGCLEVLNDVSQRVKNATSVLLHNLSTRLSGMKYSFADSHEFASTVSSNSLLYGFKELESACCGSGRFNGEAECTTNVTFCVNRNEYFFWDWFHPTQAVSKFFADFAISGKLGFTTPINFLELLSS